MQVLKRKIILVPGPDLLSEAGISSLAEKAAQPQEESHMGEMHTGEKHMEETHMEEMHTGELSGEQLPEEQLPEKKLPEKKQCRRQRGFTLIEVLGALVVGSLVFGFAAFAISKAIESARVTSFNENLALLRINVHEVYASSRGFGSTSSAAADITSDLISAGAIPDPWLDKDSSTTVHNLGGEVSVSGTLTGFTISAKSIGQDACRKIASSQAENWDKITINGETVDTVPTNLCSSDDAGSGTNTMAFTAH